MVKFDVRCFGEDVNLVLLIVEDNFDDEAEKGEE
jgi:hypothetical protein